MSVARAVTTGYVRMNDRLGELRGSGGGGAGADVEMALPPGGSAFMQAFFDEVQEIKKISTTIRGNIRQATPR